MRTLITGATGFVGGHLTESLLAAGDTVVGLARRSVWPAELSHLTSNVQLLAADLLDTNRLLHVLSETRPDRIAHLAGYADAGKSFSEPDAAWAGNLDGTLSLYNAIVRWGGSPRVLFVSTGQVYGRSGQADQPLTETAEIQPVSPYAASKAAADLLSFQMSQHPGLEIVRVRPFNHLGPRQPAQYAVGHFARQLARIEAGLAPPRLEVGDLTARRDMTDVRDMVEAYRLLLDHGRSGEVFNVGSGTAVQMAEVLDLLRGECHVPVEVIPRVERMRPTDPGIVTADTTKLRRETSWTPRFTLSQTLRDTLDSWRASVVAEPRPIYS
jgi:GDP-4-dehydro-6-deoxy-D-mannose reductase